MSTNSHKQMPKNNGTKQLFENKFIEKLTRTHAAVPISFFIFVATALVYYSIAMLNMAILYISLAFVLGLALFTLVEYCIHRFVFHMRTHTQAREKMQYAFHGVHHEYPKDKQRLAMPLVMSITIASLLFLLFRLTFPETGVPLFSGFIFGYAMYLWVHYAVHAMAPPKNIFKLLWITHSIHHYKDPKKAYGVSSPIWDIVFGTMPDGVYRQFRKQQS